MRMFLGIDEEVLVAMTLSNSSKDPQIVALPLPATIKVQYATNMSSISSAKEFQRLKERSLDLGRSIEDKILIHDVALAGRDLRINGADNKQRVNLAPPANSQCRHSHAENLQHQRTHSELLPTADGRRLRRDRADLRLRSRLCAIAERSTWLEVGTTEG